jgi:hypothetical protein
MTMRMAKDNEGRLPHLLVARTGLLCLLLGSIFFSFDVGNVVNRRLMVDPKTIEIKEVTAYVDPKEYQLFHHLPGHRPNHPDAVVVNGTLFVPRKAGERLCMDILESEPGTFMRLHYHFEDCHEQQLGNRLGEHYGRYLLANAARMPYTMTCGSFQDHDYNQLLIHGDKERRPSVLRHLEVRNIFPGPVPKNKFGALISAQDMCHQCHLMNWACHKGMDAITDIVQQDMARLAALPYCQSFEPDDAVLHLRLGDALEGRHDEGIGLLPHQAYASLIAEAEKERGTIKTISIVTQPFEVKYLRQFDRNTTLIRTSELVARDLQAFLSNRFPAAIVKIDNKAENSLKSFARLIRAKKVAICGSSTFCTMPVLGVTEGIGFVFRAQKHSPWAALATERYDNLRTWRAPRLANHIVQLMTEKELLSWLRTEDANGDQVIDAYPFLPEHNNGIMHPPGKAEVGV